MALISTETFTWKLTKIIFTVWKKEGSYRSKYNEKKGIAAKEGNTEIWHHWHDSKTIDSCKHYVGLYAKDQSVRLLSSQFHILYLSIFIIICDKLPANAIRTLYCSIDDMIPSSIQRKDIYIIYITIYHDIFGRVKYASSVKLTMLFCEHPFLYFSFMV